MCFLVYVIHDYVLTRSWTFASHPTWSLGSQPLRPQWMSTLNLDPKYLSTQLRTALLWTCPLIRRAAMFTRLILSEGDKIHSQEVHFRLLGSFLSQKPREWCINCWQWSPLSLWKIIRRFIYRYIVIQSQKLQPFSVVSI